MPPPDMTLTVDRGIGPVRSVDQVTKGLGLGFDTERLVHSEVNEWLKAPDVVAFRKAVLAGARALAPDSYGVRRELVGRCLDLYRAQPRSPEYPDSRSAVIQKSWTALEGSLLEQSADGARLHIPDAEVNVEPPQRLRDAFRLRLSPIPPSLVWCCEEVGSDLDRQESVGEDMTKAAHHKYVKRVPTGKTRPRYRYFYAHPKTKGLTASTDLKVGAKFKVRHAGKVGHFEVLEHDKQKGIVKLRHDESGRVAYVKEGDLHRMVQSFHGKFERPPKPLTLRRQEQQMRLPDTGRQPQEAKPEPKRQPVTRGTLSDLGGGTYDRIDGFAPTADEVEALALDETRAYAVVKQANGYVLASGPKSATSPGRIVDGAATHVFLRGTKGIEKVKASWVLMEADEAIASHKPDTFAQRDGYPSGVQERRYHEIEAEQHKVDRIARSIEPAITINSNPDAVNGAPIVTEGNVVLGGNGRTMGMQRAYLRYPESATALKRHLLTQAAAYGFDRATVAKMKAPILVRRIEVGDDTARMQLLGRQMNEPLTQGLDPRSEEVSLGKAYVTDDLLHSLTSAMVDGQTLSDFLTKGSSKPFVAALRRAGIIHEFNASKHVDQKSGLLNEDGRMRVERVLVARFLPSATVLDRMNPSLRANLARSAHHLLRAEQAGWDIRPALMAAVKADQDMREKSFGGGEKNIHRYLSQLEVSGASGPAASVQSNPIAQSLLFVIREHNGRNKLPAGFRAFALRASQQQNALPGMGETISPSDAINREFGLKIDTTQQMLLSMAPARWHKAERKQHSELFDRALIHSRWLVDDAVATCTAQGRAIEVEMGPLVEQVMADVRYAVDHDPMLARELGQRPITPKVVRGLVRALLEVHAQRLVKAGLAASTLRKAAAEQLDLLAYATPQPWKPTDAEINRAWSELSSFGRHYFDRYDLKDWASAFPSRQKLVEAANLVAQTGQAGALERERRSAEGEKPGANVGEWLKPTKTSAVGSHKQTAVSGAIDTSAPRPSGSGWQPIPRGKKGGFRKRRGTKWEYWYPEGQQPKQRSAKTAARAKMVVEAPEVEAVPADGNYPMVGQWVTNPETAATIMSDIADSDREKFVVLSVGADGKPINVHVAHIGIHNLVDAHPTQIFKPAVLFGAERIYVAHNHPSGEVQGSEGDQLVTDRLMRAGEVLGIGVADSMVIVRDDEGEVRWKSVRTGEGGAIDTTQAEGRVPGVEFRMKRGARSAGITRSDHAFAAIQEATAGKKSDVTLFLDSKHRVIATHVGKATHRDVFTKAISAGASALITGGGDQPIARAEAEGVGLSLLDHVVYEEGKAVSSLMERRLLKAKQLGLFDAPPRPTVKRDKPPGGGWQVVPGGRKGGFRRRRGGDWEYWYPGGKAAAPAKSKPTPQVHEGLSAHKTIEDPATLMQPDVAEATANALRSGDPDWQYVVEHDPKGTGLSKVRIVDEEGETVGYHAGEPVSVKPEPAPAKPEPKLTVKTSGRTYSDVGEKIGGARKDLAAQRAELAGMSDKDLEQQPGIAYKMVTKRLVFGTWSTENAEADRAAGVHPEASWWKRRILDSIVGKPPDSAEMRKAYRKGAQVLERSFERMRSPQDVFDFINEWQDRIKGRETKPVFIHRDKETNEFVDMTIAMGRRFAETMNIRFKQTTSYSGKRRTRLYPREAIGLRHPDPDEQKRALYFSTKAYQEALLASGHEVIKQDDKWAWSETTGKSGRKTKERVTRNKSGDDEVVFVRKLGVVERIGLGDRGHEGATGDDIMQKSGLRAVEYGNWANETERQWHTEMAHASLQDLAEVLGVPAEHVGVNGRLAIAFGARGKGGKRAAAAHYEPSRKVINLTKVMGNGTLAHEYGHFLDHAIMLAYSPERGKADFLSSGTKAKGRSNVPQDIQNAMFGVMNAIKSLSPDELIARRVQKATVLRELNESTKALNETPDAIRQAWRDGHGRRGRKTVPLGTEPPPGGWKESDKVAVPPLPEGVTEEQVAAFGDLRRRRSELYTQYEQSKGTDSPYYHNAKSAGRYWANDQELFARAFESFVESRMLDRGQRSSYLVDGTNLDMAGVYLSHGHPHRERINQAMVELLNVLKSHEQFTKSLRRMTVRLFEARHAS